MNQSIQQHSANTEANRIPTVAIVPQQQQQQQQQPQQIIAPAINAHSPLLMTPVESPRHSIILQPPVANIIQQPAFILGQVRIENVLSFY